MTRRTFAVLSLMALAIAASREGAISGVLLRQESDPVRLAELEWWHSLCCSMSGLCVSSIMLVVFFSSIILLSLVARPTFIKD